MGLDSWYIVLGVGHEHYANNVYIPQMNAKSFPSASSMTVNPVSAQWVTAATLAPQGNDADALYNNKTVESLSKPRVPTGRWWSHFPTSDYTNLHCEIMDMYGARVSHDITLELLRVA